ncbi:MAG: hypothetical protein HOP18_06055 [Deltaproteobacteria bacterium]|nr:hypothetical protein [Deltaproteobacteria bacterium]
MRNISSSRFSRFVILSAFSLLVLSCPSLVWAQAVGGMDSSTSDNSRTPFRIKLSGFLNTEPQEGSKVLKLGITDFQETYQFELIAAESIDDKQVGEGAILQQVGKFAVDFDLTGSRDLLSKVGQADPGTPLTIVGFFTQRNRKLQLESVDVVGLAGQSAPKE